MADLKFVATNSFLLLLLAALLNLFLPGQKPPSGPPPSPTKPNNHPYITIQTYPPEGWTSDEFDILNFHNQLPQFYDHLSNIVAHPPIDNHHHHRVLRLTRTTATSANYLTHVRFRRGSDRLTVFVRSHDLYVVGFQVNNGPSHLIQHDLPLYPEPYFCVGENLVMLGGMPFCTLMKGGGDYPEHLPSKLRNRAKNSLHHHNQHDVRTLDIGDSYRSLEAAAQMRRADLHFDQSSLEEAFEGLMNNGDRSPPMRNRLQISRSLLFFTQFISESLRVNPIREQMINNFGRGGMQLTEHLLLLEYGWGRASYCLQVNDDQYHSLAYGYLPRNADVVTLQQMDQIYAITLRDVEEPAVGSTRKVMRMRYEYSLREFESSRLN